MSLQNDTSTFEPSIICESSMPDPIKKKIKDDPSGETKWTTKGGT
jgi:hypothetical protein